MFDSQRRLRAASAAAVLARRLGAVVKRDQRKPTSPTGAGRPLRAKSTSALRRPSWSSGTVRPARSASSSISVRASGLRSSSAFHWSARADGQARARPARPACGAAGAASHRKDLGARGRTLCAGPSDRVEARSRARKRGLRLLTLPSHNHARSRVRGRRANFSVCAAPAPAYNQHMDRSQTSIDKIAHNVIHGRSSARLRSRHSSRPEKRARLACGAKKSRVHLRCPGTLLVPHVDDICTHRDKPRARLRALIDRRVARPGMPHLLPRAMWARPRCSPVGACSAQRPRTASGA